MLILAKLSPTVMTVIGSSMANPPPRSRSEQKLHATKCKSGQIEFG